MSYSLIKVAMMFCFPSEKFDLLFAIKIASYDFFILPYKAICSN